jgi:hypothetical protein
VTPSTPGPIGLTRRPAIRAGGTAAALITTAERAVANDVAAAGRRKTIGIQVSSISFVEGGSIQAGYQDLIGSSCDCLIPANPPREAIEARRRQTNRAVHGDHAHYHTVANPAKGEKSGDRGADPVKPTGNRPWQETQKRRRGKK